MNIKNNKQLDCSVWFEEIEKILNKPLEDENPFSELNYLIIDEREDIMKYLRKIENWIHETSCYKYCDIVRDLENRKDYEIKGLKEENAEMKFRLEGLEK